MEVFVFEIIKNSTSKLSERMIRRQMWVRDSLEREGTAWLAVSTFSVTLVQGYHFRKHAMEEEDTGTCPIALVHRKATTTLPEGGKQRQNHCCGVDFVPHPKYGELLPHSTSEYGFFFLNVVSADEIS